MTVFPYEKEDGTAFATDYYATHVFVPGKGSPSYERWLAQNGGILRKLDNRWEIVFENDADAIAFKLKYL